MIRGVNHDCYGKKIFFSEKVDQISHWFKMYHQFFFQLVPAKMDGKVHKLALPFLMLLFVEASALCKDGYFSYCDTILFGKSSPSAGNNQMRLKDGHKEFGLIFLTQSTQKQILNLLVISRGSDWNIGHFCLDFAATNLALHRPAYQSTTSIWGSEVLDASRLVHWSCSRKK